MAIQDPTGVSSDPGVQDSVHSLRSDFSQLRDDLYTLFRDAVGAGKSGSAAAKQRLSARGESLRGKYDSVTDDLRDKYDEFGGTVRDKYEQAKDAGVDGLRQVEDKIEQNPLASVAIAAGVGLIVGALFRRR